MCFRSLCSDVTPIFQGDCCLDLLPLYEISTVYSKAAVRFSVRFPVNHFQIGTVDSFPFSVLECLWHRCVLPAFEWVMVALVPVRVGVGLHCCCVAVVGGPVVGHRPSSAQIRAARLDVQPQQRQHHFSGHGSMQLFVSR